MTKAAFALRIGFTTAFVLGALNSLHAASAAWTNATSAQDWTTDTNWTAAHPQNPGEAAGFVGIITNQGFFPFEVNIPTDITIGSLVLDTPLVDLSITGMNSLTFDDGGISGKIFVGAESLNFNVPVVITNAITLSGGSHTGGGQVFFPGGISGGTNAGDTIQVSDTQLTVNFTGINSFTGRAVVKTGSLILNGPGITISGRALFINGPVFFSSVTCFASNQFNTDCEVGNMGTINLSNTSQTFGSLDNSGNVLGTGSLTLTGDNEVISIEQGTIDIGNLILTGTNLSLVYRGNRFTGQAFIGGAGLTITPPAGGNLELNVTTNPLPTPPANPGINSFFDLDFRNTIFSQGTLSKIGEGTILFEGTSGITPMTLNQGTIIMGQTSADTIAASGTTTVAGGSLIGNGTLGSGMGFTLSNTGGSVGAGLQTTPGTLTVSGNYSQGGGGTLSIKGLNSGANGADKLVVVNGSVQLNGTLSFTALPGSTFQPGDRITVLDNSSVSGITGTFSNFNAILPTTLNARVIYNPTSFVIIEFLQGCNITPNSFGIFNEYVNLSIPLFAMFSERNVRLERRLYLVRDRIRTRTSTDSDLTMNEGLFASADSLDQTIAAGRSDGCNFCDEACRPFSLYIAPLGSIGNSNNFKQQKGFDYHSWGLLMGADYAFSRAGLGAQAGFEKIDADVNDAWGRFDIKNAFAKVYGTFLPFCGRSLFIDLEAAAGKNWYSIDRNTSTGAANGNPQGWEWEGYASIGYDLLTRFRWTPLAGVQYIALFVEDYRESGAGSNDFQVAHERFHSLRTFAGMSLGTRWTYCSFSLLPEIRGYWEHEFADPNKQTQISALLSDSAFPISNLQLTGGQRNYGTVGGEILIVTDTEGSSLSFSASYDYYWNNLVHSHMLYGEFDIAF